MYLNELLCYLLLSCQRPVRTNIENHQLILSRASEINNNTMTPTVVNSEKKSSDLLWKHEFNVLFPRGYLAVCVEIISIKELLFLLLFGVAMYSLCLTSLITEMNNLTSANNKNMEVNMSDIKHTIIQTNPIRPFHFFSAVHLAVLGSVLGWTEPRTATGATAGLISGLHNTSSPKEKRNVGAQQSLNNKSNKSRGPKMQSLNPKSFIWVSVSHLSMQMIVC